MVSERYMWLVFLSLPLPLPLPLLKGRREEVGREKGKRRRRVGPRLISLAGATGKGNIIIRLMSIVMVLRECP